MAVSAKTGLIALASFCLLSACQHEVASELQNLLERDEANAGGDCTVFDDTPNAFGKPSPNLSSEEALHFFVGNSFFNKNWVEAPASTTARDGLGPLFNSRSCAGCHFKDGRGRAPQFDGEHTTGFLLRLSVPGAGEHGGPLPEPRYGGQLQDQAIAGLPAEGKPAIRYTEIKGWFADGEPYTLRKPVYFITDQAYGAFADSVRISPRVAPQMIGLGLLEAVPDSTIRALADPDDADGDGISGRTNEVWDAVHRKKALGRFGWKANQPSILQQVAAAFLGDMGITSVIFPAQNCTDFQSDCRQATNGGNPEIRDDDLAKVALYASTLAVPARRDWQDETVLLGKSLFSKAQCDACHVPVLKTGEHATIPALSNQTIRPYTDLLLHDMGEELADQRSDFEASGSEWRTPPLWGIGLFETVNDHSHYLHDGRARNLTEAILWHGGEAEAAKSHFLKLSKKERAALLRFLQSL